jgi:hypothetical protein
MKLTKERLRAMEEALGLTVPQDDRVTEIVLKFMRRADPNDPDASPQVVKTMTLTIDR